MEGHTPKCHCDECSKIQFNKAHEDVWMTMMTMLVGDFGKPSKKVIAKYFKDSEEISEEIATLKKANVELSYQVALLSRQLGKDYWDLWMKKNKK